MENRELRDAKENIVEGYLREPWNISLGSLFISSMTKVMIIYPAVSLYVIQSAWSINCHLFQGDNQVSGSAHLGGAVVAAVAWARIRKRLFWTHDFTGKFLTLALFVYKQVPSLRVLLATSSSQEISLWRWIRGEVGIGKFFSNNTSDIWN